MSVANIPTMAAEQTSAAVAQSPDDASLAFELEQRQAQVYSAGSFTPPEFRGNVANCLIAMNLAKRTGFDALMVMQSITIIHGRPTLSSQFLIGCINRSGLFSAIRYRFEGEGLARTCVAVATELATGEEIEGPPVSLQMAKDEGWSTKKGSKWITLPDLMLRYRSAAFFLRTTAPEIAMGMQTSEEAGDAYGSGSGGRRSGGASESRQSAADALASARDVTPEAEPEPAVDVQTGEIVEDIPQEMAELLDD